MVTKVPSRWKLLRARFVPEELTHQRRVSTVAMDATTAALVATAFTQLKVRKASMQGVTHVLLVGFSLNLEKHRVFFAKTSLDKARGTKEQATPGAASYLQDHSLTPQIRPTNVMRVFFVVVELMEQCHAPQARMQIEEV